MKIKHVFFDLDHTLWDFEFNSKKAYAVCFENLDINVNFEQFIDKYIPINNNYWKLYREEQVTREELEYGRLKDSFDAINYTISDEVIEKLSHDYLNYLPKFNQLFEGAIEVLEYLHPKYQLHIITNGFFEIQENKLKKSELYKYFDKIITSENVGVKKPNPIIFKYALEQVNALPEETIMIGDNLEADVQGALNVGIDAIHFAPDVVKLQPNQINKLTQILNYL